MKKYAAAIVALFALSFAGFAAANHEWVTENHVVVQDPPAMTTVVTNGKKRFTVVQDPPPMTTTVVDTDPIPHDEEPPPPPDTQAPSVPQNQQLSEIQQNSVKMTWSASTDNVGVVHYNVLLNGNEIGDTNGLEWYYQGLTCNTTYTVGLSAEDAAGNKSNPALASGPVTTAACDTPPPPTAQCSDGINNDPSEDTLIDLADPGCTDANDNTELGNPAPPSGCNVFAQPGQNLATAYNAAPPGGVVCLAAGNYGSFTTPSGSKDVTFRGVYPGTVLTGVNVGADNFHLENLEIRGSESTDNRQWPVGPILGTNGYSNFSFKNGKISRARDHMMVLVGGQVSASQLLNPVFDGILFADAEFSGLVPDAHGECVYSQAAGLVVRNSTFKNCWVMDLFITRGTWWGQEEYGNVTIENNIFWHSTCDGCNTTPGWHYYGFVQAYDDEMRDFVIRNNWFENAVATAEPTGSTVICGNNTGTPPSGWQGSVDTVPASWRVPC